MYDKFFQRLKDFKDSYVHITYSDLHPLGKKCAVVWQWQCPLGEDAFPSRFTI